MKFDLSTSKWANWFLLALVEMNWVLSLTAKILLRYAAGSTLGSGGFGMGTVGRVPKLGLGFLAERGDCILSLWIEGLRSPE